MPNSFFQFKQFIIHQDKCAMKVTTDACLFGAWIVNRVKNENHEINSVLDIGTGTGLLSLMFAQENNQVVVDAIELDEDTSIQAKENTEGLSFKNTIHIIHADARTYPFQKKYDLIICNPPFYENELKSDNLKKNIAHHQDGLLLNDLLNIIKKNLKPNGIFCLLLPYKRNDEIKKMLEKHEMDILQMTLVKQSQLHDYFRILLAGQLNTGNSPLTEFDELSIWDENRQYTAEFTELLQAYYLYL